MLVNVNGPDQVDAPAGGFLGQEVCVDGPIQWVPKGGRISLESFPGGEGRVDKALSLVLRA